MRPSLLSKTTLMLLASLMASSSATARETVREGLVIDRVTVVNVRDGSMDRNRAIIIVNDRIFKIVDAGSVAISGNARRIDGKNRFVVPGYNDMHAHNLNSASPQTSLPLMLASGITGFRQMAPAIPGLPPMPADSPALLSGPGTLLAGPAFAKAEAAKAEVDRQKAQGAGFIKLVDLPEAAFLAAIDAAEAVRLQSSGHLPLTVDPRDAITHGFDSVEHLGPTISLLLSCSTDEVPIRTVLRSIPPGAGGIDFNMDSAKLARLLANPVLIAPPQSFGVMRRVLATYSEDKCRKLASDLAASKAWVVPTLTRLEAMNLGNSPALRGNPDLRFVPAASRNLWLTVGDDFDAKLSPEQRQTLASLYDRQLKLAKLFDEAGVKMMAGTDFGGQWIVPGRSLHREFDLLAGAGISPLHILQMTTINPATYLGRADDMGTVESGKQADLVLLSANPLSSITNLHRITGVIRAGRYLSRLELDAIAARAEAALK